MNAKLNHRIATAAVSTLMGLTGLFLAIAPTVSASVSVTCDDMHWKCDGVVVVAEGEDDDMHW